MLHIYIIRKMQIKTTRYPYMPIEMAKVQNTDNTKCWQGVEQQELSFIAGGKVKLAQPLWKTVWLYLTKLNILYHSIHQAYSLVFTQRS